MDDTGERNRWLLNRLQDLLIDDSSPNFNEFAEVSNSFVEGYARFVSLGIPSQTIGLAMLGATVNIYDLFGMGRELPDLLRTLADKLEDDSRTH